MFELVDSPCLPLALKKALQAATSRLSMAEETILAWCSQLCFSVPYRHRMCLMGSLTLVKVFSGIQFSILNLSLPFEGTWDTRQQKPPSNQSATDCVVVQLHWRPQQTQRSLKVVFCTPAVQPPLTVSMVAACSGAVLAVQHGQEDYICLFSCRCTRQHALVFGHSCIEVAVDPACLAHLHFLYLNPGL